MSYINNLGQLTSREQLMEDIDAIICDWWDVTYEDQHPGDRDMLIRSLCDAVCANFPVS